jgi:hypothetical protein
MILILIYSTMIIVAEPRADRVSCVREAKDRIGEVLEVRDPWDDMGGFHRKPKIVTAFCVEGATQ